MQFTDQIKTHGEIQMRLGMIILVVGFVIAALTFGGWQELDKIIRKHTHFAMQLALPPALVRQLHADDTDNVIHLQLQLILILRRIGKLYATKVALRFRW